MFWSHFAGDPWLHFPKHGLRVSLVKQILNNCNYWIPLLRQFTLKQSIIHSPWRRAWQPIPVFLPGESHGQRSLMGYSPWGCQESDTTERLSTAQHPFCPSQASDGLSDQSWAHLAWFRFHPGLWVQACFICLSSFSDQLLLKPVLFKSHLPTFHWPDQHEAIPSISGERGKYILPQKHERKINTFL